MRRLIALASIVIALLPVEAAAADLLAFDIATAEGTAGRLRRLIQQLSKQHLLYQLRLGDVQKSDLVSTVAEIDRSLETLAQGSPSFGVPAPWTAGIRKQIRHIDEVWGPIRSIATASPYDYLRRSGEFRVREDRVADPLSVRYFDDLSSDFTAAVDELISQYDAECRTAGFPLCDAAARSGALETILERTTREAVMIFAGLDVDENKKALKKSMSDFQRQQSGNESSAFFKAAVAPEEGKSGEVTAQLLQEIRAEWDAMRGQLDVLLSSGPNDFDLDAVLKRQRQIVLHTDRLRYIMGRYYDRKHGA